MKSMIRTAAAAMLLAAGAGFAGSAALLPWVPAAQAQSGVIDGKGLTAVSHAGGGFSNEGGTSWAETNKNGDVTFRFDETGRDEWSVYLFDASRNVSLQIDLHRKMVFYADGNNPTMRPLYPITEVFGRARVAQPEPAMPSQSERVNGQARDLLENPEIAARLDNDTLQMRMRTVGRLLASDELRPRIRQRLERLEAEDTTEWQRRQAAGRQEPEPEPEAPRQPVMGPPTWTFGENDDGAFAALQSRSDCRRNCNDEEDLQTFIFIECKPGARDATITFSGIGRDDDHDRRVTAWVNIDDVRTELRAAGQSMLDGVGLKTRLRLGDPLFRELAAGRSLLYGRDRERGQRGSLKGSGKAIRAMLLACQ